MADVRRVVTWFAFSDDPGGRGAGGGVPRAARPRAWFWQSVGGGALLLAAVVLSAGVFVLLFFDTDLRDLPPAAVPGRLVFVRPAQRAPRPAVPDDVLVGDLDRALGGAARRSRCWSPRSRCDAWRRPMPGWGSLAAQPPPGRPDDARPAANGVPIARIFGLEVRVHVSWVLILAIVTLGVGAQFEVLHSGLALGAALGRGGQCDRIPLLPLGGWCTRSRMAPPPGAADSTAAS